MLYRRLRKIRLERFGRTVSEKNENNEFLPEDALGEDKAGFNASQKSSKKRSVSLATFAVSAIALVVAAVMLTYTLCGAFYKKKLADARLDIITSGSNKGIAQLELLQYLFVDNLYLLLYLLFFC